MIINWCFNENDLSLLVHLNLRQKINWFRCAGICLAWWFSINVHAQTESTVVFGDEIDAVILDAVRSGKKRIKLNLLTYQSDVYNGDREKVRIKFRNDSVYDQRVRLSRESFVIRRGWILPYSPESDQQYSRISGTDSADCKVYWGTAYEGMKDSSMLSYSRYQHDSLGRTVDYYFTFNQVLMRMHWSYEGDSVIHIESWRYENDSLTRYDRTYILELWNADSTFCMRSTIQSGNLMLGDPGSSEFRINTRTYIEYDQLDRIVMVQKKETIIRAGEPDEFEKHVLRVRYR